MNHLVVGCIVPFLIGLALYVRAGWKASLRLLILHRIVLWRS